jgi:hypothetical protein
MMSLRSTSAVISSAASTSVGEAVTLEEALCYLLYII